MGHNVGVAADRAVKNSQRTLDSAKTPEQRFKEIRSGLASGFFVTPDNQRFLLAQYDEVHALLVQNTACLATGTESIRIIADERDAALAHNAQLLHANGELLLLVGKLKEENVQFRTVYEQENSSRGTVIVVADAPVPQPEA